MPDIIYNLSLRKLNHKKMEQFILKNAEIMQNTSGTNHLPILVNILQSKTGRGHSIITKIGEMFYSNVKIH